MQILPGDLHVGAVVRVRRGRWRIVDVRAYERCQVVTLAGLAPPNDRLTRRVIAPFDRLEPIDAPSRPRMVRAAIWRRACRALIAADAPPGGLRSAARARIDLLPYQLEPAMAVLRGDGSRLLLADEVGLGKTIQAGLVVGELIERGAIDRALILTPAGLRDQWRGELDRFSLDADVVDAQAIARRAATLPPDVSPWTTIPLAIASIELVKRPEVLAAVAAAAWDLVVVDEAHGAANESDRHAAAQAICARAAYVLLITATPHCGDRRAYESLCDLGSAGDSPIVFRRTRRDVGLGGRRRVHVIHVRRSRDERRMDEALADYSSAILHERGDSWLALSVLHKRALSSAWSLAESVDRRLAALAPADDPPAEQQLLLPLGDRDGDLSPEDQPPAWPSLLSLSDAALEYRLLSALAAAARRAAVCESKIAAIVRAFRRVDERLIVFTEYRDTLDHLRRAVGPRAVALHGGMPRGERAQALTRFAREPKTVLLATDAAGEGLNLHEGCRFVINLELPWNPMRLEQRVGRVDRIGQRRRVHACHLVAAHTSETRILDRLRTRIADAQSAIGAPDPLGHDNERAIARIAVLNDTTAFHVPATAIARSERPVDPAAAIEEAERIQQLRRLALRESVDRRHQAGPLMLVARRPRLRQQLAARVLLIWQLSAADGTGRIVECRLVPVVVSGSFARLRWNRARLMSLIEDAESEIRSRISTATFAWRAEAERIDRAFRSARVRRERAIAGHLVAVRPIAFQAGLFDRRAERAHRVAAAMDLAHGGDMLARIASFERPITAWPLALALIAVCP
jgi:superfamily II DNA or RNA helicase